VSPVVSSGGMGFWGLSNFNFFLIQAVMSSSGSVMKHHVIKIISTNTNKPNISFIILLLFSKKILTNSKVDNLNRAVVLDLVCRRHTGQSIPIDLLVFIVRNSHTRYPRRDRRRSVTLVPEYVERGARVKKVKSKVRIKRAWRFNNS